MSITKVHGAYLPHWRAEHASYFVTFRLANSLPKFLAKEIKERKQEILHRAHPHQRNLTIFELDELEELHFQEINLKRFDQDACFLKQERIAEIVAEVICHFSGDRYDLFAWTLMPDHVHIVFRPLSSWSVSEILHNWKRFSALHANRILGRKGQFWQEEYYDHLIRNEEDLLRCMKYAWENSEKAKLNNWPWRGKMDEKEAVAKAFP